MKKYVYLALGLLLVIGLIGMGTFSYWHKEAESKPITMNAGTIDVSADGGPFTTSGEYVLMPDNGEEDFKPCYTGYIKFNVHNTGTNPAVLRKHITMLTTAGGLDEHVRYDLTVDGFDPVFVDSDNVTVNDIQCQWMPMGAIPPDTTWEVTQSYHLDPLTPDTMMGATMQFKIELYAEQKMGPGPAQTSAKLFLDNKTDTTYDFLIDDTWGILDWVPAAGASVGNLRVNNLNPNEYYSLIYYNDVPDTWPQPIAVVHNFNTDGNGDYTGSGIALSTWTGKVWVVPTADISGLTLSVWSPTNILFEGNIAQIL
jgi:hypothetical protein